MIKEFRDFIMRGNVIDLAVAVIMGAAFTSIVNSLVQDILMPILGLLTGGLDFRMRPEAMAEGVMASPGGVPQQRCGYRAVRMPAGKPALCITSSVSAEFSVENSPRYRIRPTRSEIRTVTRSSGPKP